MKEPIFVFGSNLMGYHGGGAAKFAHDQRGARHGIGVGLTGRAYALPTCIQPGQALRIQTIKGYVEQFKTFAEAWPADAGEPQDLEQFLLTRVGCGIAGFRDDEIAPLFAGVSPNVIVPVQWKEWVASPLYRFHNEGKLLVP